jgi:hypothetical protein
MIVATIKTRASATTWYYLWVRTFYGCPLLVPRSRRFSMVRRGIHPYVSMIAFLPIHPCICYSSRLCGSKGTLSFAPWPVFDHSTMAAALDWITTHSIYRYVIAPMYAIPLTLVSRHQASKRLYTKCNNTTNQPSSKSKSRISQVIFRCAVCLALASILTMTLDYVTPTLYVATISRYTWWRCGAVAWT